MPGGQRKVLVAAGCGSGFLADIFSEIEEEVRREKFKQLWDRYGLYVIIVAVLFVLAIGGWRGYEFWLNRKAAEAGSAFEAAIALSDQGKAAEAEQAFAKIAVEGTPGYRELARFRQAGALAQLDVPAAVCVYDGLAKSGISQTLQDLASIRAGFLLVDTAPFSELRQRLEPLAEPGRPFRHSARELLAFSAWKSNDATTAKRYVDMITGDAETPQGVRTRIDVLSALLAADGKGDAKTENGQSDNKAEGNKN
jgi:hypothetical protein